MWQLIRAELEYQQRVLLAAIFVAMPALAGFMFYLAQHTTLSVGFIDYMPIFGAWATVSHMVDTRRLERRDRQLIVLPVATHKLALARLLSLVAPFVAALVVFVVARTFLSGQTHLDVLFEVGVGLMLLLYGSQSLLEDLLSLTPKGSGYIIAGTTCAAIAVLGAYVYLTHGPWPVLARFINAPLGSMKGTVGPACFLLLGLVVGVTSVFTYGRRKSYLQA
ncbi:MAG: hypothetical protein QF689_02575 [Candidatus Latescibacteria bacterium]|jgi:hypothetical protein|nr:hypothetical protein [Gemmatimonadaceae bacterium]MDP6018154.1 hypothetical protein [Candidatus Latescibacterota bacterium]MDP7447451.1 hypothetical protein [Candidatus Latescibacterota bacterium]HJP32412.1 hypothetical protein [Candidatus Latescibacterota bacterium]